MFGKKQEGRNAVKKLADETSEAIMLRAIEGIKPITEQLLLALGRKQTMKMACKAFAQLACGFLTMAHSESLNDDDELERVEQALFSEVWGHFVTANNALEQMVKDREKKPCSDG